MEPTLYPVCLRWRGREYLVLWVPGVEGAIGQGALDHLLCDGPRQIAVFDPKTVRQSTVAHRIAWDESHHVDLDEVDTRLTHLDGREVLRQDCRMFLHAWNMLDDIAATVRGSTLDISDAMKRDAALQDIYDMVFHASLGMGDDDPDLVKPGLCWDQDDETALARGLRKLIEAGMTAAHFSHQVP